MGQNQRFEELVEQHVPLVSRFHHLRIVVAHEGLGFDMCSHHARETLVP